MKNHIILLICCFLISCNDQSEADSHVGAWTVDHVIYTCMDNNVQQEDIEYIANDFGCVVINGQSNHCITLILNSDNTGQLTTGKSATAITDNITYQFNNNSDLLRICKSENDCIDYTFLDDEIRIREIENLGGTSSCIISIRLRK